MSRPRSLMLLALVVAVVLAFPAVASTQRWATKSAAFPSYVYDDTSVKPEGALASRAGNSPDQRVLGDATAPAVLGRDYDDCSQLARAEARLDGYGSAPQAIRNAVPQRLARVVDADFAGSPRLGGPGADRVFVTAADDIAGISTSRGLAQRLTLLDDSFKPRSGPFAVIEFDAPMSGLGSPVFRSNPGFVGFGRTAGGAREFDLPNVLVDDLFNVSRRTVL